MFKFRLAVILLLWSIASPLLAEPQNPVSPADSKVLSNLEVALKNYHIPTRSIRLLSPHLAEVETDTDTIYITTDSKHIVVGSVIEVRNGKGVDLKNERIAKSVMKLVADGNAITYAAAKEKSQIVAFTDISCSYCQKLHAEIPALNARGITVHYLAYPRNGSPSAIATEMQKAWCSASPQQALSKLFDGQPLPASKGKCKGTEVQTGYDFGQGQSFTGTPTLLIGSELTPGFVTTDEIAAKLGIK